jgi:hypothetical protein
MFARMDHAAELHRELDRLAERLPRWAARLVHWLQTPSSRWVRIPVAVVLIGGGIVGFLPVLGFWMIPLGVAVLALDVPFLRRPLGKALAWLNAKLSRRAP